MGEELLPLLDRANRMTIRTMKALADLRRSPVPAVAINQAAQVNLGHGVQVGAAVANRDAQTSSE